MLERENWELLQRNSKVLSSCYLCFVVSFIVSTPIIAYIMLRKESEIDDLTTQGIAHIRQLSGDWTQDPFTDI